MEYNLIKTIETNYGYVEEEEIVMTPFPSDVTVIPGIGQIINNLSIITKIHNSDDLTKISKKNEFESTEIDQLGSGENADDTTEEIDLKNSNADKNEKIADIPFNEQKRKAMDQTVYESLMHPKMFKTKSLILKKPIQSPKKTGNMETTAKSSQKDPKKINHKFHIYE